MRAEMPLPVLGAALAVLGLLVAALVVGLVGGTFWHRRRAARRERLHRELQPHLRWLALEGAGQRSAARALRRLTWREQAEQLAAFVDAVGAAGRHQAAELARRIGLLGRAEQWMACRRWHRRLRGARVLTVAGAGRARMLELLADPHPEVRAEAADWIAAHGDEEAVTALLRSVIDDPQLRDHTLVDCLGRCGARALGPLTELLDRDDVVEPTPALLAAAHVAEPRLGPAARRWSVVGSSDARAAAARLLAHVGDADAVARLRELLGDDAPAVRVEAAAGLGRLQHWPAAPDLAAALRDPAFAVRRHAALALRRLGGPGELYLRRSIADHDRFAADMTRQVLSLPEEVTA